ncbi:MAG TPA: hypothetical protein VMG30_18660 [Acidobacteriota bacterium]|nr:hypothetical protein [Acidobacteriota bacterium]
MALFSGRKKSDVPEVFDPNPEVIHAMPARPYRVLYADLAFYADAECKRQVNDARLVVIRSEDPKQQHQIQECLPTRKKYQIGQIVDWGLNNKMIWQDNWYINPETGKAEMAWVQAVEFTGKIVAAK